MSMNSLIMDTLSTLDVPVSFLDYKGVLTTYITFMEYMGQGASYSDNKETDTEHLMQINIFSKDNYTDLVKQVKDLLTSVGFTRSYETELYENDTFYNHKILRMTINENLN